MLSAGVVKTKHARKWGPILCRHSCRANSDDKTLSVVRAEFQAFYFCGYSCSRRNGPRILQDKYYDLKYDLSNITAGQKKGIGYFPISCAVGWF